jgi:hypothetical protein
VNGWERSCATGAGREFDRTQPSPCVASVFVALRRDKTAGRLDDGEERGGAQDPAFALRGYGGQADFVRTMGLVLRTAWGGGK